ncbi:tyrosine-type recombinase/integrase [Ferrimicrobium acidiphilum]|uniref:tyrosine-type recombinase/integrase n=1 Tax=Ferrimicrobium acidiphilum TaxID=121039 RepID=UPI0023F15AB9|nr:site-specific integrase [Ferrimicrobium acidiphilum]
MDPSTGKYRYISKTVQGGPRIADRALAELVSSTKQGQSAATIEMIVNEFLTRGESSGIGLRALASYRMLAKNHIIPRLGLKRVDLLTVQDLDRLYQQMVSDGVGVSTIGHCHALIRSTLSQAVKWGWVDRNVAKLASPPASGRSVVIAPSSEELGQILSLASKRSPQLANVFALAALTGARRGEVLALRWSDYDSVAKVLTISKSVGYTSGAGVFVKSTKTDSVRSFGVDEVLEGVIVSQIEALQKSVDAGFILVADPYLFFGEPDGSKPLHPDTPTKFFRIICDSLGLPYHLHQLRHFTATQLIAAGVDVRTVANRLGHADASVTMKVYAHVLEAQDRAASEYLGSRVFIPKPIDRA